MDREGAYDALVAQLVEARLVETYTEDGGEDARLTPEGERVERQLAMTDDDGQDALMTARLGEVGA